MVHLLSLFVVLRILKTKAKPGGRAPRLRCAEHSLIVRAATSIKLGLSDKVSTYPPQDPRLLRASPLVEGFSGCFVFKLSLIGHTKREAPL